MKFPQQPRKGENFKRDWLELLAFVKANSLRSVIGGQMKRSPNGTTIVMDRTRRSSAGGDIPWKLSVSFDDPDYKWRVSSTDSSITEGTNGTKIDLSSGSTKWTASSPIKFDTDTTITVTSWIVLECGVGDGTFVIDDLTFKAVTSRTAAQEVAFRSTGSLQQEFLRLLVGKIIFTDGVPRVVQNSNPQMFIDWGFFNSRAVKCFLPPQIDPDLLA